MSVFIHANEMDFMLIILKPVMSLEYLLLSVPPIMACKVDMETTECLIFIKMFKERKNTCALDYFCF